MIEALIKVGAARGLREAAAQLIEHLDGSKGDPSCLELVDTTTVEKEDFSSEFELHTVVDCPFAEIKKAMGDWSDKGKEITEGYNLRPLSGGGAFDPICIIHRLSRQYGCGDKVVQVGCASQKGVIVSERECEKIGMSKDEAEKRLEGKACLYALKK